MCTFTILFADKFYKWLAKKIAKLENHSSHASFEKSLTLMIYKFTFMNSYTFCFILAFWERNVSKLAQQLATILIVK